MNREDHEDRKGRYFGSFAAGLLESVYRQCLMYELGIRGLDVYAEYRIKDGIQRMIWRER